MKLNSNQKKAVDEIEGQVLIIACPGSGKTTVLIERIHNMIGWGIMPDNILAITFTKEAALQMQTRYELKYEPEPICFGTIHSFCYKALVRDYGLTPSGVIKESDKWDFMREFLIPRINTDNLDDYIRNVFSSISFAKNREEHPQAVAVQNIDKDVFVKAFHAYEAYKETNGMIDFDDMLILCRKLFTEKKEALLYWQDQFPYILVDEYQDTNKIQTDIFYMLAGKNGNICVVGDDDQSLYAFRAADPSNMIDFKKRYPECKEINLSTNYRSRKKIVSYASKLIKHNKERFKKKFDAFHEEDGIVSVRSYENEVQQANAVMEMIKTYHKAGKEFNEIAILYRTNAQNQLLAHLFVKENVPFYTTETIKDIHESFIFKDIMAYYRLSHGTLTDEDGMKILNHPSRYLKAENFKKCAFEKKAMIATYLLTDVKKDQWKVDKIERLFSDIEKLKKINEPKKFVNFIMANMGYRKWIKNFCEFTKRNYEDTMEILENLVQESEAFDSFDEWFEFVVTYKEKLQEAKKNRIGVCLSTGHSAKGLEWDIVFIIDANDEIMPYKKAQTEAEFEEERRIMYVCVTRAREMVNISFIRSKKMSPYILEMGLSKDIIKIEKVAKKSA